MVDTLLINDHGDEAALIQQALASAGYMVYTAQTAQKGLDIFAKLATSIQTVVVSESLSDRPCQEVISYIRQYIGSHGVHIILLSEALSPEDHIAYMKLGVSDILGGVYTPMDVVFSIKQSRETAMMLENINRDMEVLLDQQIKLRIQSFKAFIQKRQAYCKSIMPSEIYSFFPLSQADEYDAGELIGAIEAGTLATLLQSWHKPKVLVVDDELFMCNLIEGVLYSEFDVYLAHSGKEALALFKSQQGNIDVILLDVSMPDAPGDTFIHQFLDINPHVTILMVTASQENDVIIKTLRAGAKDYIVKPFLNHRLLEVVTHAVQNHLIHTQVLKWMNIQITRQSMLSKHDNT